MSIRTKIIEFLQGFANNGGHVFVQLDDGSFHAVKGHKHAFTNHDGSSVVEVRDEEHPIQTSVLLLVDHVPDSGTSPINT